MEIGVDIAKIADFDGKDEKFLRLVLQEKEYAVYSSFSCKKRKNEYLAVRFAGKEAIFKATQDSSYLKYQILADEKGAPYVDNHPELKISLSHHGEYAIAFVVKLD